MNDTIDDFLDAHSKDTFYMLSDAPDFEEDLKDTIPVKLEEG